ncbi:Gag-Pol polyprotein [Dufourea novaeangliae]|uniref:Gag-Pol polyprotein n=1 Tax=Dufourea novaeangliae TaxID=178035 RepID=A0A154PCJ0_DUFNO|nr:Gag-Pol polyprotein [Dufourea novaeangliae]
MPTSSVIRPKDTRYPERYPEKHAEKYPGKQPERYPVKLERQDRKEAPRNEMRCFNCGDRNHFGVQCPAKNRGPRCFACREFGHRAADCEKGQEKQVNECAAITVRNNKVYKPVTVMGKQIVAFLNVGSDLHLMKAEQYVKLGCPLLTGPVIPYKGFSSGRVTTLGEFYANVKIDGNVFRMLVHVVPDTYLTYGFLIGCGLVEDAKVVLDGKNVKISRRDTKASGFCDVPEIFCISIFDESENSPAVLVKKLRYNCCG